MNKHCLTGRLTRDPEIKRKDDGKPYAKFTLAVDRQFKSESDIESCDFIPMTVFGKTAEWLGKYGKKGMKFDVIASVKIDAYINGDGEKVRTYDWYPSDIEFGERKQN